MAALASMASLLSAIGLRPRAAARTRSHATPPSPSSSLSPPLFRRWASTPTPSSSSFSGTRCVSSSATSSSPSTSSAPDFHQIITDTNASSPVVVYSKSWCPYCIQVKELLRSLGVEAEVLELDQFAEEQQIQNALYDLTGQRTVPNVFIGSKHIGGCDDTVGLHQSGELTKMLEAAGVTLK